MKKEKKPLAWGMLLRRMVLAGLLITAGILTFLRHAPPEKPEVVPTPTPFAQQERAMREEAYDKDLSALQNLMENAAADADTRAQAARQAERMVYEHQAELAIEEALQEAGCRVRLVLMQNNALTILVDGEVSSEVSASILALCTAHTDVSAENVRIIAGN